MSDGAAARIEPAVAGDREEVESIAAVCGLSVDFERELAKSYALIRVARDESGTQGFLLAWRAADELHLTDLGVLPRARRRGLARQLAQALFEEGRVAGARVVFLEVRASNAAALALYRGLGFSELDRRVGYYADTGEDAVVMQLELR